MQIGKKKLVLDHLIVQKMDDDDSAGENVQSILTHGAKALFDSEEGSGDIVCKFYLSLPIIYDISDVFSQTRRMI